MKNIIDQLTQQGIDVKQTEDQNGISFEIDGRTIVLKETAAKPRFALGVLWGGTDPSVGPFYLSETERDAELRRMLDPNDPNSLGDQDIFFRVDIGTQGEVSLCSYLASEIESMTTGEK